MQKKSPIKQRILLFVDNLGITKRDFYEITGISRGTLESDTGITEDTITKFLAEYQNVSPLWLLTGEEPVLKNDIVRKNIVGICDQCELRERLLESKDQTITAMHQTINNLQTQLCELKGCDHPKSKAISA
jgi:hypothetical protein